MAQPVTGITYSTKTVHIETRQKRHIIKSSEIISLKGSLCNSNENLITFHKDLKKYSNSKQFQFFD